MTFGADLTQAMDSDFAGMVGTPMSAVTVTDSAGAAEAGSPIAGVLVSVRIKTNGDPNPTVAIRVMRPDGVNTWNNVAPEIPLPVPARISPQITEATGLQHPIAVGDLLGVGYTKTMNTAMTRGDADSISPVVGMTHPVGTSLTYGSFENKELLIQGTVEPDADGDTFGDESQDHCVGAAGAQAGCPPPQAMPVPQKKRCKKKRKKKAKPGGQAAKKKKCRKKKK